MTIQLNTTLRNGMLDQFDTVIGQYQTLIIWSGSVPANCAAADSGTALVQFDLQQPSWNPASSGSKSLADITFSVTAIATGTAGYFRIYDGVVGTAYIQGTVTATGGGGDMTVDNTSIASGQTVNVTQFTITQAGA